MQIKHFRSGDYVKSPSAPADGDFSPVGDDSGFTKPKEMLPKPTVLKTQCNSNT